jgi:hypothetical protein
MSADKVSNVYCAVTVEVAGKRLQGDKTTKETGVQLIVPGRSGMLPAMRVLGFKREIRITSRDVKQLVGTSSGLAVLTNDRMKIILANAQTGQLEEVVRYLQSSQSVATPCKARRLAPADKAIRDVAAPAATAAAAGSNGSNAVEDLATVLEDFLYDDPLINDRKWLGQEVFGRLAATSKRLELFVLSKRRSFRLRTASCIGAPPDIIVQRISRHHCLDTLGLSGLTTLTATVAAQLADALHRTRGVGDGLRKLALRGCKALSDTAVRKLLVANPCLEILDILEIPRLSDKAFEGVPLRSLRILAAGSLGRAPVADNLGGRGSSKGNLGATSSTVALAPPQPKTRRALASFGFTTSLLSQLSKGGNAARLTHAVLGHCCDLKVLPKLSSQLQHLDLRGANLQIPTAAVNGWAPLAACNALQVLCLAGNGLLCCEALLAIVRSLSDSARLCALDLAATCVDAKFVRTVPQLPAMQGLTHLCFAHCPGLVNEGLGNIMQTLHQLEVLDVADCPYLQAPLADLLTSQHETTPLIARQAAKPMLQCLRLMAVGQTDFAGVELEATRRALRAVPGCCAKVLAGGISLDLFCGYDDLLMTSCLL